MPDLLVIGKRHWHHFLPVWLLPVALFLSMFLLGFASYPRLIFFVLVVPAFFLCFQVASKPLRSGQITKLQSVFWTVLVPFCIWGIVVFGFWGVVAFYGS